MHNGGHADNKKTVKDTAAEEIAPKPTSSCLRNFAMTLVVSSGVDAPMATTVVPIMNSSIPNATAMALAPVTIRFPAAIR